MLFVLEPAQGTPWGTLEEEQAYINAGISAAKAGKWLQPGPSMYLVGYGAMVPACRSTPWRIP